MKFVHTNIICKDIEKIAQFYIDVFECEKIKESHQYGEWLERGTGVSKADLKSVDLRLPGYEKDGPQLELFQYKDVIDQAEMSVPNKQGFRHLAFSVDNVQEIIDRVLQNGGDMLGEISKLELKSGTFSFSYVSDPEGNIIEIQNWTPKTI